MIAGATGCFQIPENKFSAGVRARNMEEATYVRRMSAYHDGTANGSNRVSAPWSESFDSLCRTAGEEDIF